MSLLKTPSKTRTPLVSRKAGKSPRPEMLIEWRDFRIQVPELTPTRVFVITSSLWVLGFFAALMAIGPYTVEPVAGDRLARIAVLPCGGKGMVLSQMTSKALEGGDIKTIPTRLLRKYEFIPELSQMSAREIVATVGDDYKVDYLLVGEALRDGSDFIWEGRLIDRAKQTSFFIDAVGLTYQAMAADLARNVRRLLGRDSETPIPGNGYFSSNTEAAFLYSEGVLQFESSNIVVALGLFERASAFDSNFSGAALYRAQCLIRLGYLDQAAELLTGLLEGPDRFPNIMSQAIKHLVFIHGKRYDLEALEPLILQGLSITGQAGLEKDNLYFLRAQAKFKDLMGEKDEAARLNHELLEKTETIADPEARIEALLSLRNFKLHGKAYDEALVLCDEALALAREELLRDRELTILAKKANILMKIRDTRLLADFVDELGQAAELAESTGNALHRVEISYWLGRIHRYLGHDDLAKSIFEEVTRESQNYGLLEFELKSAITLVDMKLTSDDVWRAERLLLHFLELPSRLPVHYELLLHDRLVRLFLKKEDYQAALVAVERHYQLAIQMRNRREMGLALNTKGAVYHRLALWTEAEHAYLKALDLQNDIPDRAAAKGTLRNLISLYKSQEKFEKVAHYSTLLAEL